MRKPAHGNNLQATKGNLEVRNSELDTKVGELSRTLNNLELKNKQLLAENAQLKPGRTVSLYWASTVVSAASVTTCLGLAYKAMRDLNFQNLRQSPTEVAGAGRGTYAAIPVLRPLLARRLLSWWLEIGTEVR